ncbi:MFS transporter [Streptomyces sp. NBC_01483]|uniref:MFS transporter n=1 Tax=Streptomyces sp. NBC_01483 TaxID=2903883 RepID=UPI002E317D59|nr:MFS transporter [Streptomyces sp. NBC_01483]
MERSPQRLAPVPDGPRAHPGCREGSRQASPWRQARHRKVGRNLPRLRGRALQATTELGLSAGVLGSVLGIGAIGGLIGASLTGRLVRRLGIGPAVVVGFTAFPVPLLLVPLADGPDPLVLSLLFLAEFGSCAGAMIVDISLGSLQTALIPHALRARVNGAYRTLTHGMRPLGALAGGALGTAIGLRPTLWIATAGTVMCLVWVLPSPVPRIRELPDSPPEPAHGAPAASAPASSPSPGY